jgi:TonB family protein
MKNAFLPFLLFSLLIHGILLLTGPREGRGRELDKRTPLRTVYRSQKEKITDFKVAKIHDSDTLQNLNRNPSFRDREAYDHGSVQDDNLPIENRALKGSPATVLEIDVHYPYLSRKNNEEGEVWAEALISPEGRLLEAVITQSSGFPRLDKAVLKGIREGRFKPAIKEGVPSESRLLLGPFRFCLKD